MGKDVALDAYGTSSDPEKYVDPKKFIQERGELIMAEVKVTDSFEKALKVFKRQCQREGFLMQIKEKRYYSKPSEVKRRKKSRSKQFSG